MKKKTAFVLESLLPVLIIVTLIFAYPAVKTVGMSIFKINGFGESIDGWEFVGINNYIRLFTTPLFLTSLKNILKIWVFGGIIVMLFSLLFAVILTGEIKGKKFFRSIVYFPNIVSVVAMATMWLLYVYDPKYGFLTSLFGKIGLQSLADFKWLATDNKFTAMLIAYCFGCIGYHMLIFISGIERISTSYYEAAYLDGAGSFKRFRHITLPLLKGVFRTNLIFWSVTTVAFFAWSQFFSPQSTDTTTITPMLYMYRQIFTSSTSMAELNIGYGASVGVVMCICVVSAFLLLSLTLKDNVEF